MIERGRYEGRSPVFDSGCRYKGRIAYLIYK